MSWSIDVTPKGRIINYVVNEVFITGDKPLFHLTRDTIFQSCTIFATKGVSNVFTSEIGVTVFLHNCGVSGPYRPSNYLDYVVN